MCSEESRRWKGFIKTIDKDILAYYIHCFTELQLVPADIQLLVRSRSVAKFRFLGSEESEF